MRYLQAMILVFLVISSVAANQFDSFQLDKSKIKQIHQFNISNMSISNITDINLTDINFTDINLTNTTDNLSDINLTDINLTNITVNTTNINLTNITENLTANITNETILKSPQIITSYFYADSDLIATKDPSGINYYHKDRTNTNRITTNEESNPVNEIKTLPFGEEIQNINGERFGFTGKELDNELNYFGARYYDSSLGIFNSIDPVKENHAYTYADNNPLYYFDPDGRDIAVLDKNLLAKKNGVEIYPIQNYLTFASKFVNYASYDPSLNFDIKEGILDSDLTFIYVTNQPDGLRIGTQNLPGRAWTDARTLEVTFNFVEFKNLFESNKVAFFYDLIHESGHQVDLGNDRRKIWDERSTDLGSAVDELKVTARIHKLLALDQPYDEAKWKEIGFTKTDYKNLQQTSKMHLQHYIDKLNGFNAKEKDASKRINPSQLLTQYYGIDM